MNAGVFTRCDRNGVSSRVSFLRFRPELEVIGFLLLRESLFTDDYINSLQLGQAKRTRHLIAILLSISEFHAAQKFDLNQLEEQALPWLPACSGSN